MRLNIEKNIFIAIYLSNNLNYVSKRFEVLKDLCAKENMIISTRSLYTVINK